MLSEADARMEIDEALKNKGWKLFGEDRNVFGERTNSAGRADYILKPASREKPLIIIEAKRKGKDLNDALHQARKYAHEFKAPIAYASDGSTIRTIHLSNFKPLMLNGEEIDQFVNESLALQYLHTNEYNTIGKKVIQSRKELINIFSSANKELRKEGLQAGVERFSEFCNILFLKIFSEEVELAEETGGNLHTSIPKEFRWAYFRNKDGNELLSYVNNVVLRHFQEEYGADIFSPLQLKSPNVLKRIIDNLDPLSLVDTNSDIKGDAFEYFLKAYLANQNKDLGEYFTPRHIVKTLVKLVNPKYGETVYDPFCGTGGMLIESFKHIYNKMPMSDSNMDKLKRETIFGGEITKNARITKMNMILTGDGHNNIVRQDSLKNPSRKKYDVVITNMPFSLGSFEEYSGLYKLGNPNGNSLCIEHCFDAVSERSSNPRIGIIIPEGILFDKKLTKLREYIYRNSHVQDIISLPAGAFKPYTGVKTSILYLTQVNQNKHRQDAVWHFTVKNEGHSLAAKKQRKDGVNDLDMFLSFKGTESEEKLLEIGFNKLDMEMVEKNDYVSIPNPYKRFQFNSKFETIALGELTEEIITRNNENALVWSVTNDKGFVRSEDRFNEQVASDDTSHYKIVPANGFAYNPSRINVGSIAFNNSEETGCVSPMYVVFCSKNEKILHPSYLYWLMQSDNLKEQIRYYAFGSVRQTLNFDDFCNMTIPVPSLSDQLNIVCEIDRKHLVIHSCQQLIENLKYERKFSKNMLKNISFDEVALGDSNYFEIYSGGTPDSTKTEYWNGGVAWISLADLPASNVITHITETKRMITDLGLKHSSARLLPTETIVVSTRATIGRIGITKIPLATNQGFKNIVIKDRSMVNPIFLANILLTIVDEMKAAAIGTTYPEISKHSLMKITVPLPSLKEQELIVAKINAEDDFIQKTENLIHSTQLQIKEILDDLYVIE